MYTKTILAETKKAFSGRVYGAFHYGSQVTGYATVDSDYDVLVVLKDYEPRVKYTYVKREIEIAFLGVDKKVFEADVQSGAYGGFIADRLLNPIIPFVNEEYIQRSEVERKKKIISWETTRLVLKEKEDAGYIDINLLYYPYKKWSKMVRYYPPYQYSIENTLRKDLREKNLKALLPGFQKAIEELDLLTEVYPGWYRIKSDFIDNTLNQPMSPEIERVKMAEREIEEIVSRYLTHSRAGDSDRDLIIKELVSKVRREVRHLKEAGFSSNLIDPERFLIQA